MMKPAMSETVLAELERAVSILNEPFETYGEELMRLARVGFESERHVPGVEHKRVKYGPHD